MTTSSEPKPTEESQPVTFNYPANARELPKRYSPLAMFMVAPGFSYNQQTGLVEPIATPEVAE